MAVELSYREAAAILTLNRPEALNALSFAIVEEIDPNGVAPRVATHWTRLKRSNDLQQTLRAARHKAYWETTYQVERSLMPFSGEPPIVYPDARVWEDLTNRRKQYASVDLKSQGKAETRILAALREPLKAPLEDFDTPLNEIMNILEPEEQRQLNRLLKKFSQGLLLASIGDPKSKGRNIR